MKKLKLIALMLCIMLSGIIFSACGDNYKKLSMRFYLNNEPIEAITLYMDDNNENASANMEVRLSGIKANQVGEVQIYASLAGLVSITNKVVEGNVCRFTVEALNPTSDAELIVKHMASDKTAKINLYIEKQSKSINLNKTNYIISIPEQGSKSSNINSSKLINLLPKDSTDKIYFKLVENLPEENIFANENQIVEIDGHTLYTGFSCNSHTDNGKTLLVYPVTVFNGKVKEYVEDRITISFFKTLKDGDLVLQANQNYLEDLINNQPITLLWNDHISNNSIDVRLQTKEGLENLDFYTKNCYSANLRQEFNEEFITLSSMGEFNYKIIASKFNENYTEVKFVLVPNNRYVGEIEEISVSLKIAGLTRPENINVYQQDKLILDNQLNSLDIYNSYANNMGSKFNFSLSPQFVMEDFSKMQIVLEVGMLNADIDGGVNPVFADSNFVNKINYNNGTFKTYTNLLEFRINGNNPLNFYLDSTGEKLISQTFSATDTIYIMYSEAKGQNANKLQIQVQAVYTGNKDYLKNSLPTTAELVFNSKEGVQKFDVELGYWDERGNFATDGLEGANSTLYFNRKDSVRYGFNLKDVVGADSVEISNTSFNINILPNTDHPLKLYKTNGVNVEGDAFVQAIYNYNNDRNRLQFCLVENGVYAEVGKYVLSISHANGVKKEFVCVVYEKIEEADINYNLTDGDYINNLPVKNEDEMLTRPFADVEADYLVAEGSSLNLNVVLNNIFTSGYFPDNSSYVEDYKFDITNSNNLDSGKTYITVMPNRNSAILSFNKGTYLNGKNGYVTLTINVKTKLFSKIILSEGQQTTSVNVTFFIYPKASKTMFNLSANNQISPLNMLAYTLEDNSVATINVGMQNNLINYLQTKRQSSNLSGVDNQAEKQNKIIWEIVSNAGKWQVLTAEEINVWQTENHKVVGGWVITSKLNDVEFVTLEIIALDNYNLQIRALSQTAEVVTLTLKATIYQFEEKFENTISINLKKPVLTNNLFVDNLLVNDNLGYYINIDAGSSFNVEASNVSYTGQVTNAGVDIYIASQDGGVGAYSLTKNFNSKIMVEGNSIVVADDRDIDLTGLKVIVFATDRLISNPASTRFSSIDAFKDIIIDGERSSYMAFELLISTGSQSNPYLIVSANDFNKLNNAKENVYYKIMNDINLAGLNLVIENCGANISTFNNNIYKISGLTFNNEKPNLFENFSGELENINFDVEYKYTIQAGSLSGEIKTNNLGVFGANFGKLKDVSVTYEGQSRFEDANYKLYNFGGLVGVNYGEIEYTKDIIGASGSITLSSNNNSVVNFGGLVGLNEEIANVASSARISGIKYSSGNLAEGEILEDYSHQTPPEFNNNSNSGSTVDVQINATNLNGFCAVGGVIGVNLSNGKLTNLKATGFIQGANNVGGIIGVNGNESGKSKYSVNVNYQFSEVLNDNDLPFIQAENYTLTNSISSVTIVGDNNLGGVVGSDYLGRYYGCRYQIIVKMLNANKGITGVENVGGIAGKATSALFEACSVTSYYWDYSNLTSTFNNKTPDIEGNNYVGGIVGNATSGNETLTNGSYNYTLATTIMGCGVNAFVKAENNSGGLLSLQSGNINVVCHSYFVGKLTGSYKKDVSIVNDINLVVLRAISYSVNETKEEVYANSLVVKEENGNTPTTLLPWAYSKELNGGYIYLLKNYTIIDGTIINAGEPIFEIAPTKVQAKIKNEFIATKVNGNYNRYTDENGKITNAYKLGNKSLTLEYYQFNLQENTSNPAVVLQHLNNWFNTYYINDLVKFEIDPKILKTISLTATSSNPNVVEIDGNKFVVRSIGEATITFTSMLNASVVDSINIEVIYPMGAVPNESNVKAFTLTNQAGAEVEQVTVQKDKTTTLFVDVLGKVMYNGSINIMQGTTYNYVANTNYQLVLDAQFKDANLTGSLNVNDYIEFGSTGNSVFVKAKQADANINLTITPTLTLTLLDGSKKTIEGNTINLNVITATGPTTVELDQSHAIVYPDYVYIVKAFVGSVSDQEDIINNTNWFDTNKENNGFGYWQFYRMYNNEWQLLTNEEIENELEINLLRTDYNNGKQNIVFAIRFKPTKNNEPVEYMARLNIFGVTNIISAQTTYNLLPQKIDSIEIKNFIFTNFEQRETSLTNTIQPYNPGLITIDMMPNTGYYDYLEIRDITGGNELITFAQVKNERLDALNTYPTITEDGLGIRLNKLNEDGEQGLDVKKIYVSTLIGSNFASIPHTIEVKAFLNDGTLISQPFTKTLDVKMLPGVNLTYHLPSGKAKWSVETGKTLTDYLAVGTDANFRATTLHSNGGIEPVEIELFNANNEKLTNNYYTVQNVANGNFRLHYIGNDADLSNLVGCKIKLAFTTISNLENGTSEQGYVSVTFNLVQFVVHDVSVTSSRTVAGYNELYGNVNYKTKFEIFFDKNDISYRYNNLFNDRTYTIHDDVPENATEITKAIYKILNALNGVNQTELTEYTVWTSGRDYDYQQYETLEKLQKAGVNYNLQERSITVANNNKVETVSVVFNLLLDNYIYKLKEDVISTEEKPTIEINKQYNLNFNVANVNKQPRLVKNEEEFLAMAGQNTSYILGEDLDLYNYTPMVLDVEEFDGNGHTITIHGFAPFTATNIEAGLFSEITNTTMLLNLQVEYKLLSGRGEGEIKTNKDGTTFIVSNRYNLGKPGSVYSSANVGGIAVTNNGIINNCKVIGTFAVETPEIERETSTIDFNIGGLVANNMETGFITNSTSALRIAGMANVGGLVYTNDGTISACSYVARDEQAPSSTAEIIENGLIYIYYGSSTKFADVEVAGLVVNNNNTILMSYVDVGTSVSNSGVLVGNMSTKDYSAGFVYNNTGNISNSYVNMDKFGLNNIGFDGFVHTGTGLIDYCYTYVNQGVATNSTNLFAPQEVENITNSYVVVADSVADTSVNHLGLTAIKRREMTLADSYKAFTFGDNISAVWYVNNSLPKLVATKENVAFKTFEPTLVETDENNNSTITTFFGFKNITETKTLNEGVETITTFTHNDNYGTQQLPYIVRDAESWNNYFANDADITKYYRLVAHINFNNTTPNSAKLTFSGNLQGNGMNISGINLYTLEEQEAIGLFAQLQDVKEVTNAIRNINLLDFNINAIETKAVGALAGIATNFNLYNINLSSNSTILGNCAVGGLAGVVRGKFDIEKVNSNISTNSSYTPSMLGYDIYLSVNNGTDIKPSQNLNNVSYAGSVFGIADGYENNSNNNYQTIKDIKVEGEVTAIGNSVGAVIGLVGEKTILQDVDVQISGYKLGGYQYSGGVVGENRGIVNKANMKFVAENSNITNTLFEGSNTTSAGIVGLNLGGLVINCEADIDIVRNKTSGSTGIVAGIVGRNINGSLFNCTYNGKIIIANSNSFEVTAGLVGAMYGSDTIKKTTNGLNKISNGLEAVPTEAKEYTINESTDSAGNVSYKVVLSGAGNIKIAGDIVNCKVSNKTITYMLTNLNKFYGFKDEPEKTFEQLISSYRLFGLAVGVVDEENYNNLTYNKNRGNLRFGFDEQDNFVVNGNVDSNGVSKYINTKINNGNEYTTNYVNSLKFNNFNNALLETNYLAYVVGHNLGLGAFDSWDRSTCNGIKVIITNGNESNNIKTNSSVENLEFVVKLQEKEGKKEIYYKSITNTTYIYGFNESTNQLDVAGDVVTDLITNNNLVDEYTNYKLYYTLKPISLDLSEETLAENNVYLRLNLSEYVTENAFDNNKVEYYKQEPTINDIISYENSHLYSTINLTVALNDNKLVVTDSMLNNNTHILISTTKTVENYATKWVDNLIKYTLINATK